MRTPAFPGSDHPVDPLPDTRKLLRLLVDVGIPPITAGALILEHPPRRITDALDSLEVLGHSRVRDPARWIIDTLRSRRDLTDVLAARRERERRWERWQRERLERDTADAAYRQQQALSARWAAAISQALSDGQLIRAVERVTSPLAGVGRRSIPVARAQLLAWAVEAHRRHPGRPLAWALAADLKAGPAAAQPLHGGLPPPPTAKHRHDDLNARIAAVLSRRPDLARVPERPRETPAPSPNRVLGRHVER